jgi:hypothetical protein
MPRPRALIAREPRGRGPAGLRLDWPAAQHERGPQLGGSHKAWDHVEPRYGGAQTVVPAVGATRALIDGIEVVVQEPKTYAEALVSLTVTSHARYDQLAATRPRVLAWWPPPAPSPRVQAADGQRRGARRAARPRGACAPGALRLC